MATDFVDTLHDTVTKRRIPVTAGNATRVIPTEAYFGMLLQLKGDGLEFKVVVEGVTAQTQGEKVAESDWVELRTFTKSGIYEVYPLPAQTRVRVVNGRMTVCQAELIKQSSQFQSGLTSEMKMWNEQLATARAVQIFENLGNANAIIEDVKRRTSFGLAQTQAALVDVRQSAALAVSAAGITPVGDFASIGAEPGLYRTMDNGRVWERPAGGGNPVPRKELEALPRSALTGVTNQANLGPPSAGPVGVPETPPSMLTMYDTVRQERVTYGIGANAVVQSLSNQPGNRTQVTAGADMAAIAKYGMFDHVTRFAEAVADPALYNRPAGAGVYTETTVTAPGIDWAAIYDGEGKLKHCGVAALHADGREWLSLVVSADRENNLLTVLPWRRTLTAINEVPPDGTPLVVNRMSKFWVDNANLIIPPGSPTTNSVVAEWGVQNLTGKRLPWLNGLDLVALAGEVGTAIVLRSNMGASWGQGIAIQGGRDIGVSVESYNGQNVVREFQAVSNSQVGFYSRGTKNYHARFVAADGVTERFSVDNAGNTNVGGKLTAPAIDVAGTITARNAPVEISYLDIHGGADDGDYSARLTADPNLKWLMSNGKYVPVQAAAQADSSAGDVATLRADFNSLLAKLRAARTLGG